MAECIRNYLAEQRSSRVTEGAHPWHLFTHTSMNLESMSSFRLWWIFHRDRIFFLPFFSFTIALFPSHCNFSKFIYRQTISYRRIYARSFIDESFRFSFRCYFFLSLDISSNLTDRKILENGNLLGMEIIARTRGDRTEKNWRRIVWFERGFFKRRLGHS